MVFPASSLTRTESEAAGPRSPAPSNKSSDCRITAALHRGLLDAAREMADRLEQNLACNTLRDVPSRLARWLLETLDRLGSDRLSLTQEELAAMLGVQRATVNAAALELKSLGAISYARGAVRIISAERLQSGTCECYRPLRGVSVRHDRPEEDLRRSA